jgi:hypothetical protein
MQTKLRTGVVSQMNRALKPGNSWYLLRTFRFSCTWGRRIIPVESDASLYKGIGHAGEQRRKAAATLGGERVTRFMSIAFYIAILQYARSLVVTRGPLAGTDRTRFVNRLAARSFWTSVALRSRAMAERQRHQKGRATVPAFFISLISHRG